MAVLCIYEVRPRKDKQGVDLISEALPFGRLWYEKADSAVDYAKFYSRSQPSVIRVFDQLGEMVEEHKCAGQFKEA